MIRNYLFVAIFLNLLLVTRVSLGDPSFKSSAPYNAIFDKVWSACAQVLDEETIQSADKAIGQIVTAPKTEMDVLRGGNVTTQTTVKVSLKKPIVVRVMVKKSTQYHGVQVGHVAMAGAIKEESDEDKEKDILGKIDALLK